MEEIISKEEFEKLMSIKGEIRGLGFQTEANFVREKKGEEALKKLENEMARLGHPYSKIRAMDFYPIGLLAVALLVIQRLFNFTDEDFKEMGQYEAKSSLVIRLFMKYFVSLENVSKEASNIWRKYYSEGDLKIVEMDEEEKKTIIRLENFKLHPILCHVLVGYFLSVIKMIVRSDHITCQETKCVHKGDEYHEFVVRW